MEKLAQASDAQNVEENQKHLEQRLAHVLKASWDDYYQTLMALPATYEIGACLKLLNIADELLNQGHNFAESSIIERYLVGGVKDNKVYNSYPFGTQLLGDMQSYASFKKLLNKDPEGLAKLLKIIPTNGPVDGWHFMQFADAFRQLFEANGFKQAYIFPATRLLSMKRPDQFVALDQTTAALFCQALAIKPLKNQDFQRYWDEIIVAVQKAPWFAMHQPMDPAQLPIHRSRFALLERLVCTPVSLEQPVIIASSDNSQSDIENKNIEADIVITLENNLLTTVNPNAEKVENTANLSVDFNHITNKPIIVKKATAQPKKLTIAKLKSAKGNKAAATKLMSQYYFANKEKFGKVDIAKSRDKIIDKLIEGESVEVAFAEVLGLS